MTIQSTMNQQEIASALNSDTGFFRHWISEPQRMMLMQLVAGEEGAHFIKQLTALKERIEQMPKTYETEAIESNDKIVHLHYFRGSVDAWVVEKDVGDTPDGDGLGQQLQAFGKVNLDGTGFNDAEWGYVSIQELIDSALEIDLHWKPKSAKDCV